MPAILKLGLDDYTDEEAKYNLISGGLRLIRGSWQPGTGQAGKLVSELFTLKGNSGSSDIVEAERRLSALFDLARTWDRDPVQESGVWLEWGIDAEPRVSAEVGYGSKRAFVRSGQMKLAQPKGSPGPFLSHYALMRIALSRMPFWENLEPRTLTDTAIAWGDVTDLSADRAYAGTAPGRISRAEISGFSGLGGQDFWFGIRGFQKGISDFDPLWELEDGTNGIDTSSQADATASGGSKKEVTFATVAGNTIRVYWTLEDLGGSPNWDHWVGRYLVLLRAKVGASTECGAQISFGSTNDEGLPKLEEVFFDNTAWQLIELGEITIPPKGHRYQTDAETGANLDKLEVRVWAERLSGAGSLDLDCLYLVPSEHLFYSRTDASILATAETIMFVLPDDSDLHLIESGTKTIARTDYSLQNWQMPLDLGLAVVVGQEENGHDLTETYDLDLDWIPRWVMYRGK